MNRGTNEFTPIHLFGLSVGAKLPREQMSQLALLLANQRLQSMAKLSPRFAAELVNQALYSGAPSDATSGR